VYKLAFRGEQEGLEQLHRLLPQFSAKLDGGVLYLDAVVVDGVERGLQMAQASDVAALGQAVRDLLQAGAELEFAPVVPWPARVGNILFPWPLPGQGTVPANGYVLLSSLASRDWQRLVLPPAVPRPPKPLVIVQGPNWSSVSSHDITVIGGDCLAFSGAGGTRPLSVLSLSWEDACGIPPVFEYVQYLYLIVGGW